MKEITEQEFNKYCAEVMGYRTWKELGYICINHRHENGKDTYDKYNPFDDLNQMAEVVEAILQNIIHTDLQGNYKRLCVDAFYHAGIMQAFRDFITSTME